MSAMNHSVQHSAAASSCPQCRTNGILSLDQARYDERGKPGPTLSSRTRFRCPKCFRVWVTTDDTELHGRFLDKAGLR